MSTTARLVILGILAAIVASMWALTFVSKRFERVASGVAALDTRRFGDLSVLVVGSGGTFENPFRGGPAVGIGHEDTLVLVDAGRAVAEGLRAAEVPAHQPTAVLLSSLAAENVVGLDDLWLTGWLGPREEPLRVLGPPGTAALVEGLQRTHAATARAAGEAWELPEAGGRLEGRELAPGERFALDGIRVQAEALGGAGLPALAYRFEAGSRAVVVATAGRDPEALVALARGADVLVAEAVVEAALEAAREAGIDRLAVLEGEAQRHPRLEEIGGWAAQAGVRTLVLTRLRPPPVFDLQYEQLLGPDFRGRVVLATDGTLVTP